MILTSLDAKRLHLMTATTILESGEEGGGRGCEKREGKKEGDFFDKKNSALKFASEVF